MGFIAELRRRNVIRMAGLYLVGAWLIVQVAGTVLPMFEAPPWVARSVVTALAVLFIPALVFSWVFELTPEGLKRDADVPAAQSIGPQTGRRMDRLIVAVLLLALVYFGVDKFVLAPHRQAAAVAAATEKGRTEAQQATVDKSVAVLPFVDMSQAQDQQYFSEGIAEELLNRLAQIPELRVAARTSAFRFSGKNLDMADIGRQLKVANLLEGSVRKEGQRLRITAQLIDAKSGFHLWSQTYERDAADVFQVQDEISTAIASALEARIAGRPADPAASQHVDPQAYDDYLQGRALVAKRVGDNCRLAVAAFERAIAKAPNFSAAHSGRAFALTIGSYWGDWLPREKAFAMARASIDEALRLDRENAEAYMTRGIIETTSLQTNAGKADMDRALALAPGSVDVLNFYGDVLHSTGNLRGAEVMKRKAMALDPLAFIHPINLGQILVSQGRVDEALQMTRRGDELGQAVGAISTWGNLVTIQVRSGRGQGALADWKAHCSPPAETEGPRCKALEVPLMPLMGRQADMERALAAMAADVHAGKPLIQLGGIKNNVGLASMYLMAAHDPHRAAPEIRVSLETVQWFGYDKLLVTSEGQKLPEEISTDPDWLAVWKDPRLAEYMAAYRANLAQFRAGH